MLSDPPDVIRSPAASDATRLVGHWAQCPVEVAAQGRVMQSSISTRAISRRDTITDELDLARPRLCTCETALISYGNLINGAEHCPCVGGERKQKAISHTTYLRGG